MLNHVAEEMNFNEKEIEIVNTVSLLHDIGKVAIQKEVLDKDEKLSGEEWSERAYKKAKTKNEAAREILRCSGSQFDPEIVAAFLNKVVETL